MFHHKFLTTLGAVLALSFARMSPMQPPKGRKSETATTSYSFMKLCREYESVKFISILERGGYHFTALQNLLTSLGDDVAALLTAAAPIFNQHSELLLIGEHRYMLKTR